MADLTVRELREMLAEYEDDMIVRVAQPTGNYWNMVAAAPVRDLEEGDVKFSTYLNQDEVIRDDESNDDGDSNEVDETIKQVVLIMI